MGESKVPFNDLKRVFERRQKECERVVIETLRSGYYVLGARLRDFEKQFASYIGVQYGIGVNSGQDALTLAIRALGIGFGDEVIIQANAYIASVLCITENGAKPVFVDADKYGGIDCSKIEQAITEKTKAILPVHLYGQPCEMDRISDIARRRGLYVVEDCAQCHGASYGKRKAGSFGTISCFSFYPTKPLGAFGDGGMCVTNSPELDEKLRMLRFYGSKERYISEIEGVNSRLDEMQAAGLAVRLKYLDEDNACRQAIAHRYLTEIKNPTVALPSIRRECTHVFHLFPVFSRDRTALAEHLSESGVATAIHYPVPPHLQRCYERLGCRRGDYPVAEQMADAELSLPIFAGMTEEEVGRVIESVNGFRAVS